MLAKQSCRRLLARPRSDNAIRVAPLALALLLATSAGCDDAARKITTGTGGGAGHQGGTGGGGAGTGGSGTGDAGTDNDAPAECRQALSDPQPWGGCPALFSDTSWKEPACRTPAFIIEERDCGTYRSRTIGWGELGFTCTYESAGQTLIAARFFEDIPAFCNRTSNTVTFGEVPSQTTCAAPVDLRGTCLPDGGVADGAGSDGGVADVPPPDASGSTSDAVCRGGAADAQTPLGAGCPLSFMGTTCVRSSVSPVEAIVHEQRCEGYRRRDYGFGTFAYQCYYDPTALTLVAGVYFDDVPRFCGGSFGITYGDIPAPGTCEAATKVDKPCGTDASAD